MIHVLTLIVMTAFGPTVTHVHFPTREACDNALMRVNGSLAQIPADRRPAGSATCSAQPEGSRP